MEVGRAALAVVAVCVLVAPTVSVVGAGPAAVEDHGPTAAADAGADPATQVETDRVRLVATVRADGDATWRVEYRTTLDDSNTTEAFESLAEDIEANPEEYTDRFADRIRTTVQSAENATGREMSARNVSVEARTDSLNGQGVITYTYEWTNFARTDGNRLVVGDAVAGFFLNDRTSLTVQWPESYGLVRVEPEPADRSGRSLTWEGTDTEFGPDQPRVVVEEGATTTSGSGSGSDSGSGGDSGSDGGDGTEPPGAGDGLPLVLVGVLVAVVVVGLVLARGGLVSRATPADGDRPDDDGDTAAAEGGGAGAATGERDTGGDETAAERPVDEELLSNEERVLGLLERRGGRVRQQEIAETLDWTEAKTSQVVSGMREEGTIEGFRLGRENVLTLPDEDLPPADGGDERD